MNNPDITFLAAMLKLVPEGHATEGEYERLNRLAALYLSNRVDPYDPQTDNTDN